MDEIKIVLDSNEYIFYFDNKSKLLSCIFNLLNVKIFIDNMIINETIRNIERESINRFFNLLKNPKFIAVSEIIPENAVNKYKNLGLKKGDVIIAALCEHVKADYLITENRHFLKGATAKDFKIISLQEFVKLVKE